LVFGVVCDFGECVATGMLELDKGGGGYNLTKKKRDVMEVKHRERRRKRELGVTKGLRGDLGGTSVQYIH
jgi:hypothetical protein